MSAIARHHNEWLEFLEPSGPFLTLPVLVRVFPQGLPKVDGKKLMRLRAAHEEWANAQDAKASDAGALHTTWVQLVLGELLEFDDQTLRSGDSVPPNLAVALAEHRETLQPSMAIVEPTGRTKAGTPRLLVSVWPSDQDLESAVPAARWAAAPLERMTQLCRSTGIRLGLVTNGERWTLVDAPVGQTAGYASWHAGLWLQEPTTLAAFEALLGVRRLFAVAETDTIEGLLDESVAFQQEVTDQLGYQVRRAVEVLVQALDRADLDRNRELLRDVPPARLYDAALTVMMRLVFLFCAEERGLLLLGDETYDANYAVSTLRALLREEADRVGVEVLERRQDAWARLLATFRAVHGGIGHEALRLPALGGSLFDPDRFPFLEGRPGATSWLETPASPLPIDNRTVLHLLEALQLLRTRGDGGRAEARKLSYRALDIEQIGHVYEGLLDHVAVRANADTLGLAGTKDKEPELSIDELDRERHHGKDKLVEFLKEHTGRSISALRRDLDTTLDEDAQHRLLVACGNDKALLKRIAPYHALLRKDVWGYPQIYRANSFMVTGGPERRQTGTHYTPKSLTEQIVTETLEPLVYVGPAEGKPRDAWTLRSADELLDLKICDMAMGSGAFLVQVCRWVAERVVEAWEEAERQGAAISADGEALEAAAGRDLLPPDREERLGFARRLVAERCVYGVDINPMAVELAKLSLWLVTLAKGRPFGFFDHNLRCGDSLLGTCNLEQIARLSLSPNVAHYQHRLFGQRIEAAVKHALSLRQRLRSITVRDITDVDDMSRLNGEASNQFSGIELIADALVGEALGTTGDARALDRALASLASQVDDHLGGVREASQSLVRKARANLSLGLPDGRQPRKPLHWALAFPEVFADDKRGFDCIITNPPFVDSETMSRSTPIERAFLASHYGCAKGNWDLYVPFIERALILSGVAGTVAMISPNKWLAAPYGSALRSYSEETLSAILNFSGDRAFPGIGVAAICSIFSKRSTASIRVTAPQDARTGPIAPAVARRQIRNKETWGFLLSAHIDILARLSATQSRLGHYATASDPFTVSEAYELKKDISEYTSGAKDFFKFVNTGTIDPYITLWGVSPVRYLKTSFTAPIIVKTTLQRDFPRRYAQACRPKLILSGMRKFEAFLDERGEFVAGKSSVIVIPNDRRLSLLTCLGILNSRLIRFFVQESFGALGIDGGINISGKLVDELPLPSNFSGSVPAIEEAAQEVLTGIERGRTASELAHLVDEAVFDTYGIGADERRTITECELRC